MEKLPSNWCIKVTLENIVMLGKWRLSGANGAMQSNNSNPEGYCFGSDGTWCTDKASHCIEITTEQFKQLVLKEDKILNYSIY